MVDVAVVGTGVMGAAAGWWLARAGAAVTLFERFATGHAHGSSHGPSRIFRLSYPDAEHVRMAQEALPLWRRLEAESGETLLLAGGGLDTGEDLATRAAVLEGCGVRFQLLDATAVSRRFPALTIEPGTAALHQPDGAVIRAELAWRTLVSAAVARGARLREGVAVLGLQTVAGGVRLQTTAGTLRADAAVVTAGAWARPLLAGAGVELPTVATRETVAYFAVPGGLPDPTPTLVDWGTGSRYLLHSPGDGVKAGIHQATHVVDPDSPAEVDHETARRITEWVTARCPGADPVPRRSETCLYTNTADEGFVLERHGPLIVGSACSGHGFKFAPLIGRRLAEMALGMSPP
ncbi:MAG TPA: FAD-dependent oxidoreductase [Candidatus Dormibacteraeota bacterium]|nr:FAD-dependent oxidoreductase [Candidatus Dormibacteraeota bacterium]